MESIDVDATGSIDYDEFLAATMNMSQLQVSSLAGTPCLNPEAHPPSQSHLLGCTDVSARAPPVSYMCCTTVHRPSAVFLRRCSHSRSGEAMPCCCCMTGLPVQMEENMYRAFQHFDTDNSGTISQAELREALRVSTAPARFCWLAPEASQALCMSCGHMPSTRCAPVCLSMTWITMMRAAKAAQA